jgi:hypothetical protein
MAHFLGRLNSRAVGRVETENNHYVQQLTEKTNDPIVHSHCDSSFISTVICSSIVMGQSNALVALLYDRHQRSMFGYSGNATEEREEAIRVDTTDTI